VPLLALAVTVKTTLQALLLVLAGLLQFFWW
jgi:hypothetical protein